MMIRKRGKFVPCLLHTFSEKNVFGHDSTVLDSESWYNVDQSLMS